MLALYADDPTYTLSAVTFRMSTTSHSPDVIGVAVPCKNESKQNMKENAIKKQIFLV